MKQFLVNLIVRLWPVMPHRIKVWAYLNDKSCCEGDAQCAECKGECEDCK
jgi:hypothetical protein